MNHDCCNYNTKNKTIKKCIRKDNKTFCLPRRFSRDDCLTKKIRGFSMKSSCAPYKFCNKRQIGGKRQNKTKKQFLYNPNNPKLSFDVYIDKNPKDTIPIKYTTVQDVKETIRKLERLYKTGKYTHKRIWQVGMIMKVRLHAMKKHKKTKYPNAKYVNQRYSLAYRYFKFLGKRTKVKGELNRKKLIFKID